jgi:hypothetical protein
VEARIEGGQGPERAVVPYMDGWIFSDSAVRTTNLKFLMPVFNSSIEHGLARFAFDSELLFMRISSYHYVCSATENIF